LIPYFDNEEAKARLRAEFKQRDGVRFSKGCVGGLDCLNFAAECMFDSGAIQRIELPREYAMNGAGSEMLALIRGAIASVPNMRRVWEAGDTSAPESVVRFGDVLIVAGKKAMNHFAIAGDWPDVWDCFPGRGVSRGNLFGGKLLRRLNSVWRAYGQSKIFNGGRAGAT